ncbi:flavin reductase family protein [Aquibacillus halophilus]|uniref:Flavin reductase family protein n=1 Tax=Aquibacillus halophilus TaxID=930132 RepID=A0A6A8DST7_9BACI|nr:flavin reductase family protein [Aquibacillus halophilus]MRH44272.1 flavin reductase family protein [Aquibacillus halophilus]
MIIDQKQFKDHDMSKLVKGAVVPRPIAWVSTVDENGNDNIAPFSFFTVASMDPITFCFSVASAKERTNGEKDTLLNIKQTGNFVINIVNETLANKMYLSSKPYQFSDDEFDKAGIKKATSNLVKSSRVSEAPVSMECELDQIVTVGEGYLILGRLVCYHIQDDIRMDNDKVDPEKLNVIGRMAGDYTYIRDFFELPNPRFDKGD